MKKIDESIICAGFGGQGIMMMGKLLAQAAMIERYNTTWMPSYGAEVRGGTAHSMIRISTRKIPSPLVFAPDTCIIMNKPSFTKFINRVRDKGLVIANSSLIDTTVKKKGLNLINIPVTNIATELGNVKVANMVALGIYAKLKNILSLDSLMLALEELFLKKKDLISLNKEALKKGASLV